MSREKEKRSYSQHALTIVALVYILLAVLVEIALVIVYNKLGNQSLVYVITMICIPASALIIASVLIYISHMTSVHLDKLTYAVNRVAAGDFGVRIDDTGKNTFTDLYENFNKMVAELSAVETLRDDYVSNLSHEIKTPLSSINGFARLLYDGGLSDEERNDILELIIKETDRLSNLSQNIMLLSRLENQNVVTERHSFRLDSQIKECLIMQEKEWEEKGITINSSLTPITYNGDEQLLKQLWINFLNNAIKFTPKGGEINIKIEKKPGKIIVCIQDNGIGMTQEECEHIFDKFYQVASGQGSGLGLAICKRICYLVGGDAKVESKPGEGTKIVVELPQ